MIIKTPCQKCGKKKAIKNIVTFIPGDCHIKTGNKCYKCGWSPNNQKDKCVTTDSCKSLSRVV